LPDPTIVPLEEAYGESPYLKETPILTPPVLLLPAEFASSEDTVEDIGTHADISLLTALSPVMPTKSEALDFVDEMFMPHSAVPLPPPPAAEVARRPRSMKNDKALVLNEIDPHQHHPPHAYSQEGKAKGENGPIASAPADGAAVNTEEEP